jgi:RNA polymerase sigma-70 factor (ECF subfamily)
MKETIDESAISLQALRAGDRSELARMVDLYSPSIYGLAIKILNDGQDAEDVLQETFIKAIRALPDFEGRSSLSTWLHRIAVNEALLFLRKQKPGTISFDQEEPGEEEGEQQIQIVDWCCLPEEELLSAESKRFLDNAIKNLPQTLRLVFMLRDVEGFTIRETAEILKISEMNVKTRLLRARLHLRQELSHYYGDMLGERPAK